MAGADTALALVALALCIWTLAHSALCAVLAQRAYRAPRPPAAWPPAPKDVLVMRPCAGAEPHLHEALMSGAALRPHAPRALVHLTAIGDAAAPMAAHSAAMLKVLGLAATSVETHTDAANHKAGQLAYCDERLAQFSVCVCIDSDVIIEPDTLAALCAPFKDETCGAVWLPFVQVGAPQTLGDRINGAILATSLQSFGVLRHLDNGHGVGKIMAIRARALEQIGGWRSVAHLLGEDTALSQRLVRAGWQVLCAPSVGYTKASARSLRVVFARYTRWAMVMRRQRPMIFWSYPFVICPMPLLVTAWIGLSAFAPTVLDAWGCASFVVWILCARMAVSYVGRRAAGTRFVWHKDFCDAFLSDAMLCCSFVAAATKRSLVWRGRRMGPDAPPSSAI